MKKIFTFITTAILIATVFLPQHVAAQSPEKMSYQAIVRDAGNDLVTSTVVGMQISILQGSASGTVVYAETQTPTTNANGLVSIEIGNGTLVNGNFTTIDWSNGPYFLKTETDPTGGVSYTITGTSQLLSVPYALYAEISESALTDEVDDADADSLNELQDLSLSENTLSLTDDPTTVDLSGYVNNWDESGGTVYKDSGDVAIGTNNAMGYKLRVSGSTNVTANIDVGGNVTANGVTFGKVYLINSGIIITTDSDQKQLYWDEINGEIDIVNNSGDWCDYWWRSQKATTADGKAAAVSSSTTETIITGTNSNDNSFEIHFGQADGTSGWCSIWLQYANGAMVGHFIKY